MPKVYRLTRRLETKDLKRALDELAAATRRGELDAAAKVRLHLQTSHRAALEILSARVPPESRGFKHTGSGKNLSATEVARELKAPEAISGHWYYSGEIEAAGLPDLLADFGGMKPDPLRRTSLSVRTASIRWKGSDPQSAGHLELDDAKAFGGKVRFTLTTTLTQKRGCSVRERAAEFAAIKAQAGIDFTQAKVAVLPDPEAGPWEPLPAACLLVDHCIERVGRDVLASGFDWRTLAGVHPDGKGVEHRFASYAQGGAATFRWETQVNQFVRQALPGFRKTKVEYVDGYFYAADLAPDWQLLLHFDTHPGLRIGRVFKVRCGVRTQGEALPKFTRTAPVLRCAGAAYSQHHDFAPEFAFDTAEELDQILAGLQGFLTDYVHRLGEALRAVLLPGLADFTAVLPVNGSMSAKDAWRLARRELAKMGGSPALLRVHLYGSVDSLHYRKDDRAQLPADGRLTCFHGWEFGCTHGNEAFSLQVPYAGLIQRMSCPGFTSQQEAPLEALAGDDWLDSPAMALAMQAALAKFSRRYVPMQGLVGLPMLTRSSGRPLWRCQLELSGSTADGEGWVRIEHFVDATTGRPSHTLFDERFPDRATPNRVFTEQVEAGEKPAQ